MDTPASRSNYFELICSQGPIRFRLDRLLACRKTGIADLSAQLIEALHCKVRYFSDGVVIGGKAFVEKVLNDRRDIFTGKRRARGAKEMKFGVDYVRRGS